MTHHGALTALGVRLLGAVILMFVVAFVGGYFAGVAMGVVAGWALRNATVTLRSQRDRADSKTRETQAGSRQLTVQTRRWMPVWNQRFRN